jgi:hypothetical protein
MEFQPKAVLPLVEEIGKRQECPGDGLIGARFGSIPEDDRHESLPRHSMLSLLIHEDLQSLRLVPPVRIFLIPLR